MCDITQALDVYKTVLLAVQGAVNGAPECGSAYAPLDGDRVLLYAVLAADLHTDGNTFRDRNVNLTKIFAGISKTGAPLDALVFAGDNTNSAAECEYVNLRGMLALNRRFVRVIPAMGNHDSGGTSVGTAGEKPFSVASARHRAFLRHCGIESEENRFSVCVKGFPFIALGTEEMLQNNAYLSPAQLAWLDEELTSAAEKARIAFVIGHQPPAGINGAEKAEAGLGGQSDEVMRILRKHADKGLTVLYVSGHMHADFSEKSFENPQPRLYFLNLPSLLYSGGHGAALEVYPDRALIRARDFLKGEWLGEYSVKY